MDDKPERVEQISDTIANIQQSISVINKELAATSAKADRPWYHDPSLIIALLALLFSFGTTAVSYIRANQQDIQARGAS
jgi:hypothetical protein